MAFSKTMAPAPELPVPSFEEYGEDVADLEADARHLYARGKINPFFFDEAKEVLGWENVGLQLDSTFPKLEKSREGAFGSRHSGVEGHRSRETVVT